MSKIGRLTAFLGLLTSDVIAVVKTENPRLYQAIERMHETMFEESLDADGVKIMHDCAAQMTAIADGYDDQIAAFLKSDLSPMKLNDTQLFVRLSMMLGNPDLDTEKLVAAHPSFQRATSAGGLMSFVQLIQLNRDTVIEAIRAYDDGVYNMATVDAEQRSATG